MSKPGVLVMVNSLCFGGAEKHAVGLVNGLDTEEFRLAFAFIKKDDALLADIERNRLQACFSLGASKGMEWRPLRELVRRIDVLAIDIVLCTNGYAATYALLAAWLSERPVRVIEVFHTTVLHRWQERLRMWFYQRVFRRCDALIYVSQLQRDHWQQRGLRAKHVRVIHNGIDVEWFTDTDSAARKKELRAELGFGPDDYVIGICAALRPEKAHRDFLAGIARLRDQGLPAKGLIIGEGPERPRITAEIQALQLESHVVITGLQRDVRPCLAISDVMVLTSHAVETFSLAALESMSMGKPMVLTRIGGAEEQVTPGENGYLYECGDLEALTEHLRALADPDTRARLGQAAAERVRRHFTRELMIAAYTEELRRFGQVNAPLPSRSYGEPALAPRAADRPPRCDRSELT